MNTALALPHAILFDFDGTLADTAPDLVEATQRLLDAQGLPRLPNNDLRAAASAGAKGLLWVALQVAPNEPDFDRLRQHFLTEYRACLTQKTHLFEGIAALLQHLQKKGIVWGIVTNKATDLTTPIVQNLLLEAGYVPATVVCGDTTPYAKPHPAPLLHACSEIGVMPDQCWYVGDDRRDIEAAQNAGCVPIAVGYGYHTQDDPPFTWGAALMVNNPWALLKIIKNY